MHIYTTWLQIYYIYIYLYIYTHTRENLEGYTSDANSSHFTVVGFLFLLLTGTF